MSFEDCVSRSWCLLPGGGHGLASLAMEQLCEVVFPMAAATLGVGGVHCLEMPSDQLFVPDQNALLHVSEDGSDPVDLGRGQRHRGFQLEQNEPGEPEIVLGHAEG